ncbi:endolytic transglycosylase MltG [Ferrimonas lipolytica]|uniref:Endolytic murein transglycosylase n=1 Tax=Ferrimonas lipolytica TaxID=2724191 RepID=A0A6H1UBY0_9GAMM|nr:endolytic transglycosylase MltG [Ferrimonas lipolytica]QIZ76544.1 endolytic transglycosylase MltG [Ferrimonas lipolytica]
MTRWFKGLLIAFGIALTITAAAALFVSQQVQKALTAELRIDATTEVTIAPGQSVRQLLLQWQQRGWIDSELWLRLALKLKPQLAGIKAGTYHLADDLTVEQALQHLKEGVEAQFSITLVEGGTIKEWLAQIQQHPRLVHTISSVQELTAALDIDDANPEGWFYPDTYSYSVGSSDVDLLSRAHQRMQQAVTTTWAERQQDLPLKSAYELLILASIIEKETAVAAERPLVSSVFINRLNKGMRLQTDPTVIYGLGDSYHGDITRKHLKTTTPYNTYRIDGLTPTPIANPSLASLQAAAAPQASKYLYFVANGEGGHTFSLNLKDHNRAVQRYLKMNK